MGRIGSIFKHKALNVTTIIDIILGEGICFGEIALLGTGVNNQSYRNLNYFNWH